MAKQGVSEFWDKTKKVAGDAARIVADTAVTVADKTVEAVVSTANKIQEGIQEKKDAFLKTRQEEVNAAIEQIQSAVALSLLAFLGDSPVELTKGQIDKIKEIFPIPREQCVLWADAEFDLRPSGIVCTEKGVFIKSNIELWGKKTNKDDEKKEIERSVLFYYKWEDFEPAWFISDNPEENRALMVEPQCTQRFINACKTLADQIAQAEAAIADLAFDDNEIEALLAKIVPIEVAAIQSAEAAVFIEQKAHINVPGGHGEMAEEAITQLDRLLGLDAVVVGRNNAKDGADRRVEGIAIQTKYYKTALGSLEACFRPEDGMYRYMQDGKPMQLEVPKDQYDKVLAGFERKIEQGKVQGVTDPQEAKNIVRKGRLTYEQAVNLTKPGTIESLAYDAVTGVITCSCVFGITFVVTVFLSWRKSGDLKQAIKAGASAGIQVFGLSFMQHMLVNQIARTSLANSLIAPSQYVVGKLGYHASATIVNGLRTLSGKGPIYGAAASKHLAKILRSNAVTSALTFTVFSIPETYGLATKKISTAQYVKNMSVLLASIAGGAGGALAAGLTAAKVAGAAGTTVAPGVGTVVGIAGGFVGGAVGAMAVDTVGDILREDDAEIIGRFFNAIVSCMIGQYFLDAAEMDKLIKKLDEVQSKEFKVLFGKVFKAEKQEEIIRDFLKPSFEAVVAERENFELPSEEMIMEALVEDCEESND